jgi:Toluene-4-monooxygenase system protein B (TmoB)
MPLPLYGFMEGDTIGLLILADEHESVQSLAEKLRDAASLRVASQGDWEVVYQGAVLDPATPLSQANLAPLQRFDLRRKYGLSETRNGG